MHEDTSKYMFISKTANSGGIPNNSVFLYINLHKMPSTKTAIAENNAII